MRVRSNWSSFNYTCYLSLAEKEKRRLPLCVTAQNPAQTFPDTREVWEITHRHAYVVLEQPQKQIIYQKESWGFQGMCACLHACMWCVYACQHCVRVSMCGWKMGWDSRYTQWAYNHSHASARTITTHTHTPMAYTFIQNLMSPFIYLLPYILSNPHNSPARLIPSSSVYRLIWAPEHLKSFNVKKGSQDLSLGLSNSSQPCCCHAFLTPKPSLFWHWLQETTVRVPLLYDKPAWWKCFSDYLWDVRADNVQISQEEEHAKLWLHNQSPGRNQGGQMRAGNTTDVIRERSELWMLKRRPSGFHRNHSLIRLNLGHNFLSWINPTYTPCSLSSLGFH